MEAQDGISLFLFSNQSSMMNEKNVLKLEYYG